MREREMRTERDKTGLQVGMKRKERVQKFKDMQNWETDCFSIQTRF